MKIVEPIHVAIPITAGERFLTLRSSETPLPILQKTESRNYIRSAALQTKLGFDITMWMRCRTLKLTQFVGLFGQFYALHSHNETGIHIHIMRRQTGPCCDVVGWSRSWIVAKRCVAEFVPPEIQWYWLGMCGIDFSYFCSVSIRFLKKKHSDSVRNEFDSVPFNKTQFGSDMMVIYYLCNSWVVNLQQILQRQWMTWLWRHWVTHVTQNNDNK